MVKLFDAILQNPQVKPTSWAFWLANDGDESARLTRQFLEVCLSKIRSEKHENILDDLRAGDYAQVESLLHEFVAHELLRQLGLYPQYEPNIQGQTPDLSFTVEREQYIGDVLLVHSPTKTVKDFDNGTGEAIDTSNPSESRAKKIGDRLATKASKYKQPDLPLVLFGFLGDHRIMQVNSFEQALFGRTLNEINTDPFPNAGQAPIMLGGILLPNEEGHIPYKNLSAVVVCDWFDTLNRNDPGKRLHCFVLHHYSCNCPLTEEAFDQFGQAMWMPVGTKEWTLRLVGTSNRVAKFVASENKFHFGVYSGDQPW